MCLNEAGVEWVLAVVRISIMQWFMYFGGGMGSTWFRLHPAGCVLPQGLFMKAPARGCTLSGPDPQAQPCP